MNDTVLGFAGLFFGSVMWSVAVFTPGNQTMLAFGGGLILGFSAMTIYLAWKRERPR